MWPWEYLKVTLGTPIFKAIYTHAHSWRNYVVLEKKLRLKFPNPSCSCVKTNC